MSLFAVNKGYFDDVDVVNILNVEKDLHDHFLNNDKLAKLLATIQKPKA